MTQDILDMQMLEGKCTYGEWLRWVETAEDWKYLVVKAGGMARKSDLDRWLVARYGITVGEAHDIANHVEYLNRRLWWKMNGELSWALARTEPTYAQYGLDATELGAL